MWGSNVGVAEPLIQASLLGEAIDGGPVAVFVADERMRYLAVNRYACELLGYERAELLALTVADVVASPGAAEDYERMMRAGSGAGTTALTRKDGATVPARYLARETRIARMPVYVSVVWPEEES
jgi:PAS domain S-box-containing protein